MTVLRSHQRGYLYAPALFDWDWEIAFKQAKAWNLEHKCFVDWGPNWGLDYLIARWERMAHHERFFLELIAEDCNYFTLVSLLARGEAIGDCLYRELREQWETT